MVEGIFIVFGFILGTILGSFANALGIRSLTKISFWGRSYCPSCKHILGWYDLFPVLSFLFLRGKCRYCHKKIHYRYFAVELILGIIVALFFFDTFNKYHLVVNLELQNINDFYNLGEVKISSSAYNFSLILSDIAFRLFGITIFTIVFLTDIEEMIIPDRIVIPGIIIAFIWQLILVIVKVAFLYYFLTQNSIGQLLLPPHSDYYYRHALDIIFPLFWAVISGIVIGGFFLLLIIITRGKGMGGGDVKLGAFIGLFLGFPASLLAILLSFLTGAIFSVGLIILDKKHFGQVIPFGPFLVLGSLITLFWGNQIINWYLNIQF